MVQEKKVCGMCMHMREERGEEKGKETEVKMLESRGEVIKEILLFFNFSERLKLVKIEN